MKIRDIYRFAAVVLAATGTAATGSPWSPYSSWGWATSPGTDAPRYNQRKARKAARRVGKAVSR